MKLPNYIFIGGGLRFNADYLRRIFTNKIYVRNLTIDDAAEFVDAVTYGFVKNKEVLSDEGFTPVIHRKNMNLTSLGNTAFIAKYHPSELIRKEFAGVFEQMKSII